MALSVASPLDHIPPPFMDNNNSDNGNNGQGEGAGAHQHVDAQTIGQFFNLLSHVLFPSQRHSDDTRTNNRTTLPAHQGQGDQNNDNANDSDMPPLEPIISTQTSSTASMDVDVDSNDNNAAPLRHSQEDSSDEPPGLLDVSESEYELSDSDDDDDDDDGSEAENVEMIVDPNSDIPALEPIPPALTQGSSSTELPRRHHVTVEDDPEELDRDAPPALERNSRPYSSYRIGNRRARNEEVHVSNQRQRTATATGPSTPRVETPDPTPPEGSSPSSSSSSPALSSQGNYPDRPIRPLPRNGLLPSRPPNAAHLFGMPGMHGAGQGDPGSAFRQMFTTMFGSPPPPHMHTNPGEGAPEPQPAAAPINPDNNLDNSNTNSNAGDLPQQQPNAHRGPPPGFIDVMFRVLRTPGGNVDIQAAQPAQGEGGDAPGFQGEVPFHVMEQFFRNMFTMGPDGFFNLPQEVEREDPERANRLLKGLDVVPHGLVKRLLKVASMQEQGGSGLGGDAVCAVCWDSLLDIDGHSFSELEATMEKEKLAAEEADIAAARSGSDGSAPPAQAPGVPASADPTAAAAALDPAQILKEKLGEDKPTKGDTEEEPRVVSLPCGRVFHAACLIPWFSRPRHTTCPNCRFDIDPESLTYRHLPARPSPPRPRPAQAPTQDQARMSMRRQYMREVAQEGAREAQALALELLRAEPQGSRAQLTREDRIPPTSVEQSAASVPSNAGNERVQSANILPLPQSAQLQPAAIDAQTQTSQQPRQTRGARHFVHTFGFMPPIPAGTDATVITLNFDFIVNAPGVGHPQANPSVNAHEGQVPDDGSGPRVTPPLSNVPVPPNAPNAPIGGLHDHHFRDLMNFTNLFGGNNAGGAPATAAAPAPAPAGPPEATGPQGAAHGGMPAGIPPAFFGIFGDPGMPINGMPRSGTRSAQPRPRKEWTPPPPPGLTLRERIERDERAMGLRCSDVNCGIAPTDEDPTPDIPLEALKQIAIHSDGESSVAEAKLVCEHRLHPSCLVAAERVAGWSTDKNSGERIEVSCPKCLHVGHVHKPDWDEGVRMRMI